MAAATIVVLIAVGIYLFNLPTQPSSTNKRTIAVLPFTNLSGNQEYEYFTDGIMEDILTQLSKIGELTVISRTTMMQYKGIKKTLKEIGKELNAGIALEGSVRRSGNRIRISSQLIDAESDKHLWAETYDREMQDVFAIQSDVAQRIAAALAVKLAPREKELIEKKPTENMEAYNYYLKGRQYYYGYNKQANENAIQLFKRALELDTNYALALSGLGESYSQRVDQYGYPAAWADSSMRVSQIAISKDPNLAEGYKALGNAYYTKRQIKKSIEANMKAVELNPNYSPAVANIGAGNRILGNFTEALRWLKKALVIDPNFAFTYRMIGELYFRLADDEKAEEWCRKALILQPDLTSGYYFLMWIHLYQGKYEESSEECKKYLSYEPDDIDALNLLALIEVLNHNYVQARE